MEYYKDLNGHFKRPKNSLIIAIVFLSLAIGFFLVTLIDKGFKWHYFIYSIIMSLNGVMAFAKYKGRQLWNKSYIRINDESIEVKVLSQKKIAQWTNFNSIDLTENKLRLLPYDKGFQYVSFDMLESDTVDEITNIISKIAKGKNLTINQ